MEQGVRTEGKARVNGLLGHLEWLSTSKALHSLEAAIVASWKEGVVKESQAKDFGEALLICGQPVYANISGLVLKRNINKSTGNSFEFNFSGIRGASSSWAESNIAGCKFCHAPKELFGLGILYPG